MGFCTFSIAKSCVSLCKESSHFRALNATHNLKLHPREVFWPAGFCTNDPLRASSHEACCSCVLMSIETGKIAKKIANKILPAEPLRFFQLLIFLLYAIWAKCVCWGLEENWPNYCRRICFQRSRDGTASRRTRNNVYCLLQKTCRQMLLHLQLQKEWQAGCKGSGGSFFSGFRCKPNDGTNKPS